MLALDDLSISMRYLAFELLSVRYLAALGARQTAHKPRHTNMFVSHIGGCLRLLCFNERVNLVCRAKESSPPINTGSFKVRACRDVALH